MKYITVTEIDSSGNKNETAQIVLEDSEIKIISGDKGNVEFLRNLIDGHSLLKDKQDTEKFEIIPEVFSNLSRLIFSEVKETE